MHYIQLLFIVWLCTFTNQKKPEKEKMQKFFKKMEYLLMRKPHRHIVSNTNLQDECAAGEELRICRPTCEPTCLNWKPPCSTVCAHGKCVCKKGFARQNGVCIPILACKMMKTDEIKTKKKQHIHSDSYNIAKVHKVSQTAKKESSKMSLAYRRSLLVTLPPSSHGSSNIEFRLPKRLNLAPPILESSAAIDVRQHSGTALARPNSEPLDSTDHFSTTQLPRKFLSRHSQETVSRTPITENWETETENDSNHSSTEKPVTHSSNIKNTPTNSAPPILHLRRRKMKRNLPNLKPVNIYNDFPASAIKKSVESAKLSESNLAPPPGRLRTAHAVNPPPPLTAPRFVNKLAVDPLKVKKKLAPPTENDVISKLTPPTEGHQKLAPPPLPPGAPAITPATPIGPPSVTPFTYFRQRRIERKKRILEKMLREQESIELLD